MTHPIERPASPAEKRPSGRAASIGTIALAFAIFGFARGFRSEAPGRDEAASLGRDIASLTSTRRDSAPSPAMPARTYWGFVRTVYGRIDEDRILAAAAGVTFYGLLAVFPAIAAFVSLFGMLADPARIEQQLMSLADILPGGTVQIIGDQLQRIVANGNSTLSVALLTSLMISLWSANAGTKAMLDALNVASRRRETSNFVWLNLRSLAFTLGGMAFLAGVLGAVVVIPVVLAFVGLGSGTTWLMWIGRWPALFLATVIALYLLYRFGPSPPRRQDAGHMAGAVFAAAGWLATSMAFSRYVAQFGTYNQTYGSLGAAIGFMTWMWLSITVILVGAEVNAVRDATVPPTEPQA